MKKIIIAFIGAALLAAGADAKSYKRGVSEDKFSIRNQMSPLEPGVSWYYSWRSTPGAGYQNEVIDFDGYDFVPMVWNGNYDAQAILEYAASHPGCKYLLGFNEPNFTNQANMTPQAAAEQWPAVVDLAREAGLALVAPAMNYSPNEPYQSPTKWFDEFVELVGTDAFDYVAIHNYGGLGGMQTLAEQFHERYGKDVWVTEFCYWPDEGNPYCHVAPATQIASMVETVEWLEKTPWIYRYAWFKATGAHDSNPSANYGLIISENGLGEKQLSPQGLVYVNMSEFDPEVWHAEGEEIPATEYIDRTLASIAPGAREDAPKPIEISAFSSGATLDYQLDVPVDDDYVVTLTVSGVGEPVRFDPCLRIDLVEGDEATTLCPATSFTLPGSDSEYVTRKFNVHLPAGHCTLRLADAAPYSPSGIRISSLRFASAAGIAGVMAEETPTDDTLYNLHGIAVDKASAAPGIYVRQGRKVIVK